MVDRMAAASDKLEALKSNFNEKGMAK